MRYYEIPLRIACWMTHISLSITKLQSSLQILKKSTSHILRVKCAKRRFQLLTKRHPRSLLITSEQEVQSPLIIHRTVKSIEKSSIPHMTLENLLTRKQEMNIQPTKRRELTKSLNQFSEHTSHQLLSFTEGAEFYVQVDDFGGGFVLAAWGEM